MVTRENPVSTWYGAILFCSGEGILFHTRATVIESFEAVFPSGWRPPHHRTNHAVAVDSSSTECLFVEEVYLQQIKKKAKAEGKTCHSKTMLSLEKPIKLL